jgi:hypothetical protein
MPLNGNVVCVVAFPIVHADAELRSIAGAYYQVILDGDMEHNTIIRVRGLGCTKAWKGEISDDKGDLGQTLS